MTTIKHAGIEIGWERIGPKRALEYLSFNTHNVPLSKRKVSEYASDMKSGRWKKGPGCIVFAKTGELLDGQTRLQAIIEAGVEIELCVQRGFDRSILPTIDPQSKPAWAFLKWYGFSYAKVCASAAKIAMNYQADRPLTSWASKSSVTAFAVDHPFVQTVAQAAEQAAKFIPAGPLAAVMFVATQDGDHRDKIHSFVAGLTDPREDFTPGDPRHELRLWLDRKRQERRRVQASDIDLFNAIARAWNFHLSGDPIKAFHTRNDAAGIPITGAVRDGARVAPSSVRLAA